MGKKIIYIFTILALIVSANGFKAAAGDISTDCLCGASDYEVICGLHENTEEDICFHIYVVFDTSMQIQSITPLSCVTRILSHKKCVICNSMDIDYGNWTTKIHAKITGPCMNGTHAYSTSCSTCKFSDTGTVQCSPRPGGGCITPSECEDEGC
ncbi:MAG: hypothetical protein FWE82_01325 [Defluviitaleaceae bacterium]|nr:hypothetical protein [Defluviitaleaceae bacterium]